MSIIDQLRKKRDEAYAQLNPFDQGKTAASVRATQNQQPKPQGNSLVGKNDNQPGFQITNNSLTRGLSRTYDQLNPLDNNRTWKQRTPTNYNAIDAQIGNMTNNKAFGAVSRGSTSVLAGVGRYGGAGTAQLAGGAYDLLTPGKGTNRVSDWGNKQARELDVVGREEGNSPVYTGTQVASEIVGMKAVPKVIMSGVNKVPQLAKGANAVTKAWDTKAVPQIANTVQKGFNKVNMPTVGKVADYGVRNGLKAVDVAEDVLMTAKMTAQDASRGTQITPQRVATDAAMTIVGNPIISGLTGGASKVVSTGANLARQKLPTPNLSSKVSALQATVQQALKSGREDIAHSVSKEIQQIETPAPGSLRAIIRNVKNLSENIKPLNEDGFIQVGRTPKNIHPEDQATMADLIDSVRGIQKFSPSIQQELELQASHIAERYGIPMPSTLEELADEFDTRLMQEGVGKKTGIFGSKPLNEYGFVQVPGKAGQGGYDRGISPEQLNEFEKALIPAGLPKPQRETIVKSLNEQGIQPRFYKKGQRQQALLDLTEEYELARRPQKPNVREGGYVQMPGTADTPETVKVFIKSKFRDGGGYTDLPVIRKVENKTLYQGGSADGRQFWTENKKYAEQFGDVTEKTGNFYQVDNGNRMTTVYVDVDKVQPNRPSIKDKIKNSLKSLNENEGGYVKNPFYKGDEITEGLSKEQSEFINAYAEMIQDMGEGNGVDILSDGRRVSSNYRPGLDEKKLSKADWFNEARKQIESGKGAYGASEEYAKLSKSPIELASDEVRARNGGGLLENQKEIQKRTQEIVNERNKATRPTENVSPSVRQVSPKNETPKQAIQPQEPQRQSLSQELDSQYQGQKMKKDLGSQQSRTAPVQNNKSERPYKQSNTSENIIPDNDVKKYVNEQVKAQQTQSKTPLKQRINNFVDGAKHAFIDDTVAYERYVKDKGTRAELREGVDKVRGSSMIARQFAEDNGIKSLGKMNTDDLNDFQQYLIAKRSMELKSRDIKTGRTDEMDKALVSKLGDKFKDQEALVRDYTKKMLDYSVEGNLISKELRDSLLKENPNYVPMNRVMDAIESQGLQKSKQLGSLSKQSVVQNIKGSDKIVENPIETMLLNTERMVNEVQRNKVAQQLANQGELVERVLKDGDTVKPGYDTISYLDKGVKTRIEVPALVAKEMKNLNSVLPDWASTTINVLGLPTKALRAGATSANPIFVASNLVRDQLQTAVTGSLTANLKGTPKAFLAAFDPSMKGASLRSELRRNGIIGSEFRQTYGYKSGQLMKELQANGQLPKGALERIKHPINTLADIIGTTENFTRAQQFYGTAGDVTKKSQAARNNSLNFSRAGVVTRQVNKLVPFINAGVQGGRLSVNLVKDRPARAVGATAVLVSAALTAKAYNEGKNKDLYDRLSDEEKKNNIIWFLPGAKYNPKENRVDGIAKVPMPQMFYPFLDAVNNLKGKPEDVLRLGANVFNASTGIDLTNPINQLTPTIVKPAVEIGLNKSLYTGNDLVSDWEKNKNPEDVGDKYSTGLAKGIASKTGIKAPYIDNIVGNYGGGLAKDLSKSLTDNPTNTKDGGGIGKMFSNGFDRRFGSSSITSQYDLQANVTNEQKNQIKKSDAYKNLSKEDQTKLLDRMDADSKAIAGYKAKVEQGRESEIKKDLSTRQEQILSGKFSPDLYTSNGKLVGSSNKKKTYTEKYNDLLTESNDPQNGWSSVDKITKNKELNRLKVQKDHEEDTIDLYGMNKDDVYNFLTTDPNGNTYKDKLLAYGDALVKAGIENKNKFRDKYGNVKLDGAKKGGSGRKGGKKATDLTAVKNNNATLQTFKNLDKLLASARGSTNVSPKKVATRKPVLKQIKAKK